jgi:hypothetical protein
MDCGLILTKLRGSCDNIAGWIQNVCLGLDRCGRETVRDKIRWIMNQQRRFYDWRTTTQSNLIPRSYDPRSQLFHSNRYAVRNPRRPFVDRRPLHRRLPLAGILTCHPNPRRRMTGVGLSQRPNISIQT